MDIKGKKSKLFAYVMKGFYFINYTDACNFKIQWHELKLSRKYICISKLYRSNKILFTCVEIWLMHQNFHQKLNLKLDFLCFRNIYAEINSCLHISYFLISSCIPLFIINSSAINKYERIHLKCVFFQKTLFYLSRHYLL